jgi:hypothetical protein
MQGYFTSRSCALAARAFSLLSTFYFCFEIRRQTFVLSLLPLAAEALFSRPGRSKNRPSSAAAWSQ